MRRFGRHIALWCVLLFSCTVMSPSFGWEAVAGEFDHDHSDRVHTQPGNPVEHTKFDPFHEGALQHDGHDRAGHVLSHLQGYVSHDMPRFSRSGESGTVETDTGTLSGVSLPPEDRPPILALSQPQVC